MSFNLLPPHCVIDICSYLDNSDKLSALAVFDNWIATITSCSKQMEKFQLDLDKFIVKKWKNEELPDVPFKHVNIKIWDRFYTDKFYPNPFIQVLKKFKETITSVNIKFSRASAEFVADIMNVLQNATRLRIAARLYINKGYYFAINLHKVECLELILDGNARWGVLETRGYISHFKYNKSIQEFRLQLKILHYLRPDELSDFASTLSNLRHFYLTDTRNEMPIDASFSTKLESLEVNYFNGLAALLRSQKDSLKKLVIPYLRGLQLQLSEKPKEELMDLVMNEMKLEYFAWNGTVIINNK